MRSSTLEPRGFLAHERACGEVTGEESKYKRMFPCVAPLLQSPRLTLVRKREKLWVAGVVITLPRDHHAITT